MTGVTEQMTRDIDLSTDALALHRARAIVNPDPARWL